MSTNRDSVFGNTLHILSPSGDITIITTLSLSGERTKFEKYVPPPRGRGRPSTKNAF